MRGDVDELGGKDIRWLKELYHRIEKAVEDYQLRHQLPPNGLILHAEDWDMLRTFFDHDKTNTLMALPVTINDDLHPGEFHLTGHIDRP